VGGTHSRGLVSDDHGRLHGVAAHCKVVAAISFIAAVVVTPRQQWWAFLLHAVILTGAAMYAELPIGQLARRLTIELPFISFALLLPLLGRSPKVEVIGLSLSEPGLWAAWGIIAKGTLGVGTTIVLASTTPVPQLIAAFERLRVPRTLTAITSFMIRYLDIVTVEMQRMRIARESRGDRSRWLWQARAVASSAGALFVRSYERGERVYLSMESRGYNGSMPSAAGADLEVRWLASLLPTLAATAIAATAWIVR
jgi:cobalt/nickel transport system permease protein